MTDDTDKYRLLPSSSDPNGRDSVSKVGRQIRFSATLMPWMLAYAEWLVLECLEQPKVVARQTRARALSRSPVTYQHLRTLEQRKDFVAYCDELQRGPLEAARAKFIQAFPTYVEAHAEALDTARRAKDVQAVARLTEPVLDRVYPKKTEAAPAAQVVVLLTPSQATGVAPAYTAPPILVTEPAPPTLPADTADVTDDPDTTWEPA